MALDALGDLIGGLLGLFDVFGQGGPRSARFLVAAWLAALAAAGGFWRWHALLLERFGGWTIFVAIVWALFSIYLIGASMSSAGRAFGKHTAKSRRAG
jgi:hypothetical protein